MKTDRFINKQGEKLETAFHQGNKEGTLIIIGHGVTGNMDRFTSVGLAEGLSAKGWNCLRLSFSGNGGSEGRFQEATISKEVEDLKAVLEQVGDGVKISYIGHSMGGAVGVKTAAEDSRIHALVNMAGMVRTEKFCEVEFGEITPGEGNMWDEEGCPLSQAFVDDLQEIGDLFSELKSLRVPILFLHGTADDVVLPADSTDGYDAVSSEKKLVLQEGEEHTFSEKGMETSVQEVDSWLNQVFL